MAGRIALMFGEGIPPRFIAAVTCREAAASELRAREFVADLTAGNITTDLSAALTFGAVALQNFIG